VALLDLHPQARQELDRNFLPEAQVVAEPQVGEVRQRRVGAIERAVRSIP
jgi:hypothetical protein